MRIVYSAIIHVPFKFEHAGSQVIFFDPKADYAAEEAQRVYRGAAPLRGAAG